MTLDQRVAQMLGMRDLTIARLEQSLEDIREELAQLVASQPVTARSVASQFTNTTQRTGEETV